MREYSVSGQNLTVVSGATLVFIRPAAGKVIEVIEAWCEQEANATSAQCAIELGVCSWVTTAPTLVSATPTPLKGSDPVSGITGGTAGAAGTAGVNASVEGTRTNVMSGGPRNFNALQGFLWDPSVLKGATLILNGSETSFAAYMKFRTGPTTLTGWAFGMKYREIG